MVADVVETVDAWELVKVIGAAVVVNLLSEFVIVKVVRLVDAFNFAEKFGISDNVDVLKVEGERVDVVTVVNSCPCTFKVVIDLSGLVMNFAAEVLELFEKAESVDFLDAIVNFVSTVTDVEVGNVVEVEDFADVSELMKVVVVFDVGTDVERVDVKLFEAAVFSVVVDVVVNLAGWLVVFGILSIFELNVRVFSVVIVVVIKDLGADVELDEMN